MSLEGKPSIEILDIEVKPSKKFKIGATKEALISKMLKLKPTELSNFYTEV